MVCFCIFVDYQVLLLLFNKYKTLQNIAYLVVTYYILNKLYSFNIKEIYLSIAQRQYSSNSILSRCSSAYFLDVDSLLDILLNYYFNFLFNQ